MQRKLPSIAVLILVLFGSATSASGEPGLSPELRRFADLIVERLDLMKGVAAYKFGADRPVEDLAREAKVIEAGKAQAGRLGIEPESVTPFLQAQMDAAKRVQHLWISAWQNNAAPMPEKAPDLATELRPAISNATYLVLRLLLRARPQLDAIENREALADYLHGGMMGLGLGDVDAWKIIEGAFAAQLSPGSGPTLVERIRASGILRIGTTGDYPPFSHWTARRSPALISIWPASWPAIWGSSRFRAYVLADADGRFFHRQFRYRDKRHNQYAGTVENRFFIKALPHGRQSPDCPL